MESTLVVYSLAESFGTLSAQSTNGIYLFGDCFLRLDLPPIPTTRRSRIRESRVKNPFFLRTDLFLSESSAINVLEIPAITAWSCPEGPPPATLIVNA